MQVIGIFPNRDERALVRSQLAKFGNVLTVANLREAKAEIQKNKAADFVIIDDSSGDRTLRRRWSDDLEKDISTFEFLETLYELPQTPLVLVCCGEKTSTDDLLYYNELGVDLILRRPYGAKELGDKFDEAQAILNNPPESLMTWWTLRSHLRKGEIDRALLTLEPLARSQPDDVRLANLYASVLFKSGGQESMDRAQAVLKRLENKLPESISVKRKLFELYKAKKDIEKTFDKGLELLQLAPSETVLESLVTLAREFSASRPVGSRPFLRIFQRLIEMPATKKAQQAAFAVSEELTEKIADSDQLYQFIEALEAFEPEGISKLMAGVAKAVARVGAVDDVTFAKIGQLFQKITPGEPTTVERYFDILIARNDLLTAEQIANQAKNAKNFSTNFYAAATRLALAQNRLKEASDMLHLGRKSRPSDDRWDELAKMWKARFEALNSKK